MQIQCRVFCIFMFSAAVLCVIFHSYFTITMQIDHIQSADITHCIFHTIDSYKVIKATVELIIVV